MNDELKLRNRLKEARTEKVLSQAQLAEMVGVSRNTISSIETGQFNPTAKLALVLCIALDKKFEELFYFLRRKQMVKIVLLIFRRTHIRYRNREHNGEYQHNTFLQPKKGQGRRYTEVRESSRYRDPDYWCIVDSGFCRIILE